MMQPDNPLFTKHSAQLKQQVYILIYTHFDKNESTSAQSLCYFKPRALQHILEALFKLPFYPGQLALEIEFD